MELLQSLFSVVLNILYVVDPNHRHIHLLAPPSTSSFLSLKGVMETMYIYHTSFHRIHVIY